MQAANSAWLTYEQVFRLDNSLEDKQDDYFFNYIMPGLAIKVEFEGVQFCPVQTFRDENFRIII